MGKFSIEGFAKDCKQAMANAVDKQSAAKACLEAAMKEHELADIIEVLNAAIPAGASVGEMIVHASPELTMLYARVPPKMQSGIHNHTVFACIGQLAGEERSVVYDKTEGGGLRAVETMAVRAGEVMTLPADAIHHIENPNQEIGSALHLYGGDFGALMDQRSLWSSHGHKETSFSFEALIKESAIAMKQTGNDQGLNALVQAIPAVKPMVDSL